MAHNIAPVAPNRAPVAHNMQRHASYRIRACSLPRTSQGFVCCTDDGMGPCLTTKDCGWQ